MIWDVLEALALLLIVVGGYLLFGPVALIGGGVLIVALSWLTNRREVTKK